MNNIDILTKIAPYWGTINVKEKVTFIKHGDGSWEYVQYIDPMALKDGLDSDSFLTVFIPTKDDIIKFISQNATRRGIVLCDELLHPTYIGLFNILSSFEYSDGIEMLKKLWEEKEFKFLK